MHRSVACLRDDLLARVNTERVRVVALVVDDQQLLEELRSLWVVDEDGVEAWLDEVHVDEHLLFSIDFLGEVLERFLSLAESGLVVLVGCLRDIFVAASSMPQVRGARTV